MAIENRAAFSRKSEEFDLYKEKYNFKIVFSFTYSFCSLGARLLLFSKCSQRLQRCLL